MSIGREVFISVDVETSGPIPGKFSLLSIGACVVFDPTRQFSCELKPINGNADPDALAVTGLSLDKLKQVGIRPVKAMREFGDWLDAAHTADESIVFVGLNAPFDWSFINYYFHRYAGRNPFGFTALDIKALYMGVMGTTWHDTRSSRISEQLQPTLRSTHSAVDDALYQAELFRLIYARLPPPP